MRHRLIIAALVALLVTCWQSAPAQVGNTSEQGPAKLAVLVVFDQLRGDYLEKWRELFGDGGFKRLQTEGAWFVNCHYPYSETVTAAGHASLVTGASPWKHGIIGNEWYDRETGKTVAAVAGDPRLKGADGGGVSPWRRRQETVGDVLLGATTGKAKIAGLSIKDRAAILMAALRAQIVYWLNSGRFTTSPFYRDKNHPWIDEFNNSRAIDRIAPESWTLLRPDLDYVRYSGPDDVPSEGTGYSQGRTFPHPFAAKNYDSLTCSPFGNDLLLALAKKTIESEKLGQGEVSDLLCLSFSSNDLIGHTWGPDSQEVLDVTLRSDLIVKGLLETLDAQVGKGRYVLVLSADHGVCPIPEVAKSQGKDAGRISANLPKQANQFLQDTFAKGQKAANWFANSSGQEYYLNRAVLKDQGLASADVEKALADWMVTQPGIQAAYTRTQLENLKLETADELTARVRRTFDPERSGDVLVIQRPYYLFGNGNATGRTTHGTPHPYDTHVPLLVYGGGIMPGRHEERVVPQQAASILARALRVPAPAAAEYGVPKGLFKDE